MAVGRIQLRRGLEATLATSALYQGEMFYATDTKALYVGNGDGTNKLLSALNIAANGVYATVDALETALPTGADGIYIVSGTGHWYYWSGSAWTDGGDYDFIGAKGDKGDAGTSAYASAVAGGYSGTESDFQTDLASISGLAAAIDAIVGV